MAVKVDTLTSLSGSGINIPPSEKQNEKAKDQLENIGLSSASQDVITAFAAAEAQASALEKAEEPEEPFFSFKTLGKISVVGGGFMADAYYLFVISDVLSIMDKIYPQNNNDTSMVASTALWGAVAGQLLFGGLADIIGRRIIFMVTMSLTTIGALGSCLSFETKTFSVYQQLAFWRFILGFGVGGEYPLAASVSAEGASAKSRGRMMAAVFSMQGAGQLLAAAIVNILLRAGVSYEVTWRVCLAFGILPGIIIVYFRARMHESAAFTNSTKKRVSPVNNLGAAFRVWWKEMIGTAGTWCLLDIAFYGNNLFNTTITKLMGLGSTIEEQALNSLYVTLMAIPGYYVTVFALDCIGRWRIQFGGFFLLTSLFIILGAAFEPLSKIPSLFFILYGLTYFFSNFGPNATTYIIPGEFYPSQVKATCHGLSAASGKIGAGIAGYIFPPLQQGVGVRAVLYLCAGVCAAGGLLTFLIPDYTADSLESIKAEQLKKFNLILDSYAQDNTQSVELDVDEGGEFEKVAI